MTNPKITLYAFETPEGCFNMSPYCTKAEILLKMAGLPYQLEIPEDYKSFSKGKLPVMKDGDAVIEDSEFIRLHIAEKHGKTLDRTLTGTAIASGHAMMRMLDERTILGLVTGRWVDDSGWRVIEPMFFGELPQEERKAVGPAMREQVSEGVKAQGFGRHTREQQNRLLEADINSVAALLGEKNWLFSDEPTYLDASLFGFLANFYAAPPATVLTELVAKRPNLVAYVNRGLEKWYPAARSILSAA